MQQAHGCEYLELNLSCGAVASTVVRPTKCIIYKKLKLMYNRDNKDRPMGCFVLKLQVQTVHGRIVDGRHRSLLYVVGNAVLKCVRICKTRISLLRRTVLSVHKTETKLKGGQSGCQ